MTYLRLLGIAALLGLLGLVSPRLASAQIIITPPPAGAVLILNPNTICLDNANQDVCLTRGGPGILTVSAVGLANNLDFDIDLETSATQIGFSSPAGAVGITLTGLDLTMAPGTQLGVGTSTPDAGHAAHFFLGSAGAVDASISYPGIVIERNGNAGIQFLSPTSGTQTLQFGDQADNDRGQIRYAHIGDSFTFRTDALDRLVLDATGIALAGAIYTERFIEVVTTTKTTTLAESFEIYTNTGDADGTTFTLLNDPTIGAQSTFIATEAQTMTISASAGETIESDGVTCGTSITLTDGQSVVIVAATGGSGAQWHVIGGVGFTCNP